MFWAEDGHIFFSEAYNLGLTSFITTYAGYLHTIPRIIAYSTLHLPYAYTFFQVNSFCTAFYKAILL